MFLFNWRRRFAPALTLFALTLATACGSDELDRATLADCQRLRDHMVVLRMETVTADHDQHRNAIRSSLDPFVSSCTESTSTEQLRCGLGAADFPALSACASGGAQ